MATDLKKLLDEQRKAQEQITKLQAQIDEARQEHITGIRDKHAQEYADLGTTPEEIWADLLQGANRRNAGALNRRARSPNGTRAVKQKGAAKYVNPENADQVYTGRGPYPKWVPRDKEGKPDMEALKHAKYQPK